MCSAFPILSSLILGLGILLVTRTRRKHEELDHAENDELRAQLQLVTAQLERCQQGIPNPPSHGFTPIPRQMPPPHLIPTDQEKHSK